MTMYTDEQLKTLRAQAFADYAVIAEAHVGAEMAVKIAAIESVFSRYVDLSIVDPAEMLYRVVDEHVFARVESDASGAHTRIYRPTLPLLTAVLEDVDLVEDLPFDFTTHLRFMRIMELALVEHEYAQPHTEQARRAQLQSWIERYGHCKSLYPLHYVVDMVSDTPAQASKFAGYLSLLQDAGLTAAPDHAGLSM